MSTPPTWILWLFSACVHPADRDEVIGDLSELFHFRAVEGGENRATAWLLVQLIKSAPGFVFQSFFWKNIMLKNYIKLTYRTLFKQKLQATINVASLTIGITLCILIMLFVRNEMSFDQFHAGHEFIYQMQDVRFEPDGSSNGGNTNGPLPLGAALVEEIPGIETFSRSWEDVYFVRIGDQIFQDQALFVDPSFLDIFTFPLVSGGSANPMGNNTDIVLTSSYAKTYFGTEDPIGKTIEIRIKAEYQEFNVAGVIADPPPESSFQFAFLAPIAPWIQVEFPQAEGKFGWSLVETYFSLNPEVHIEDLNIPFDKLYAKHNGDYLATLRERAPYPDSLQPATFRPIPIAQVHLSRQSDPIYSYVLAAIGFCILLIACINYMTLAIARSMSRSREVGIRKSFGAQKGQLISQFWGESMFMTLISTFLGLICAWQLLPMFNDLTGKNLTLSLIDNWIIPLGIVGVITITGVISGSYPAFVLASFRPVDILKNRVRVSGSNLFTKSLVTLQFALSIGLIIGTLVMHNQMDFLVHQDRGFQSEQTVVVKLNGTEGETVRDRFQQVVQSGNSVQSVSLASSSFGYRGTTGFVFNYEGERAHIDILRVDASFLSALDIPVRLGHDFLPEQTGNWESEAIVNQALVDRFKLTDPIGSVVPGMPAELAPTIIGVTDNFKYQSLYQDVGPLVVSQAELDDFKYIYAVLAPGSISEALQALEQSWKQFTNDIPFQFEFLDDRMAQIYANDLRWSKVINAASAAAIFLALFGLVGLTSLSVKSRTKELGIRKVLGASPLRIMGLLSKSFIFNILVGATIAIPVAIIVTRKWLENFAFRAEMGIEVYLLPIVIVLVAATGTIILQSLSTIKEDPIGALRSE